MNVGATVDVHEVLLDWDRASSLFFTWSCTCGRAKGGQGDQKVVWASVEGHVGQHGKFVFIDEEGNIL